MEQNTTLLSVKQLCERLNISRTTLFHEHKRDNPHFPKKIAVTKGRVGYRLADVDRYLLIQQSPDAWQYGRVGKAA